VTASSGKANEWEVRVLTSNKNQDFIFGGNDIDLSMRCVYIACQEGIAETFQVLSSYLFTPAPDGLSSRGQMNSFSLIS
jgi:hypothetical protein